jgi:D-beta-D-heptose 7-phosphate kinase / D-beta-D-heptose 1-phosphate adenosyltransferase
VWLAFVALGRYNFFMRKLLEQLERIASPRVLLVGDLMLDEFVYGDVERISPEAPVPVLRVVRRDVRLGGAANVANALATLGAKVECVGTIGDDANGKTMTRLLEECGATANLQIDATRPTITKSRMVGLAQHRHAQQILRVDEEDASPISTDLAATISATITASLAGADVLAVEDYGKGLLCENTLPVWLSAAAAQGVLSVIDPYLTDDYRRYRGAGVITPNRYEASHASGIDIQTCDDADRAGHLLLEQTQGRAVVVTLDKEGAYVVEDGRKGVHVPTRERKVYDVTGAGDVVMAMLSLALASGANLPEAVALSNVAGGLEVERFGVVPIRRDEIEAELREHMGDYDE